MNSAAALAALQRLDVPAFTTADARALFDESTVAASKTLARLQHAGVLFSIARGMWTLRADVDPFLLAEVLTSPSSSYVSLQTALYRRGLIEQIPAVIYVVSLSRTETIKTSVGTFSVHRVAPEMFGGFEVLENGAKLATAEKALVDLFYMGRARSRLFAALPELDRPKDFDVKAARRWIARIPDARWRASTLRRLEAVVRPKAKS